MASRLTTRALRALVAHFLEEDLGPGDVTTLATVPETVQARGRIIAKEPLVLAGSDAAYAVFLELDGRVLFDKAAHDGQTIEPGDTVALVSGPARAILTGERLALNILQRLSGIATLTRRYVDEVRGSKARIVDTRKTTPGLRVLEKQAVVAGGGHNHRLGLYDGVLVKDNHIVAAGGVTAAVLAARAASPHTQRIEVEVDDLDELREALSLEVDAILLDNMTVEETREAVSLARARPGGDRIMLESSGRVTLETVRGYADAGVDLISVGALTHSAPAVDLGLDLEIVTPRSAATGVVCHSRQ